MGTEIDNIIEFEQTLDLPLDDAPPLSQGQLLPA
jgi:tartronate-semialdehyde synthase